MDVTSQLEMIGRTNMLLESEDLYSFSKDKAPSNYVTPIEKCSGFETFKISTINGSFMRWKGPPSDN